MWFRGRQRFTIEQLARLELFRGCTRTQLARVCSLCTHLDVEPGRVLIRQGAAPRECYVVIDGHGIVSVDDRRVGHVTGGRFFGEVGLVDGRAREATITAASAMSVLVFSQLEFWAVLEVAPLVAAAILRTHVAHLRAAEELICRLEARLDAVSSNPTASGDTSRRAGPPLAAGSMPRAVGSAQHLGAERSVHDGSDAENLLM